MKDSMNCYIDSSISKWLLDSLNITELFNNKLPEIELFIIESCADAKI